jgi:NAD(P)-dependent dehydrogenase (short-subunit alcohol dehydrogenase family)
MDGSGSRAFGDDLLAGRHVLVTGGGTGLGRALAERFAGVGARLSLCGRRQEPLEEAAAAIRAAGGCAEGIPADVRDADAVDRLVEEAERRQGPLDTLVNNAAGNFLAATEELSASAFDAVVRTNLHGSFHCTTACGRRWIERGTPGVVLSITTTYARTGSAFVVPSAASKAGVEAMTRSLAVEWGRHGIRLNAVAPGPIPTEGAWSRLVPDAAAEKAMLARIPLGRFGGPDDLADLAAFLVSDLASWLTGTVIALDGGEVLAAGGQFNELARRPPDELRALFAALRSERRRG